MRFFVVVVEAERKHAAVVAELFILAAVGDIDRGGVEGVGSLVGDSRKHSAAGPVLLEFEAEFLVGGAELREADGLSIEVYLCCLPFSDDGSVFVFTAAREQQQQAGQYGEKCADTS